MSNIFCLQTQQNKARQLEEQLKETESSLQVKAVKEPLRVVVLIKPTNVLTNCDILIYGRGVINTEQKASQYFAPLIFCQRLFGFPRSSKLAQNKLAFSFKQ